MKAKYIHFKRSGRPMKALAKDVGEMRKVMQEALAQLGHFSPYIFLGDRRPGSDQTYFHSSTPFAVRMRLAGGWGVVVWTHGDVVGDVESLPRNPIYQAALVRGHTVKWWAYGGGCPMRKALTVLKGMIESPCYYRARLARAEADLALIQSDVRVSVGRLYE